MKILFRAPVLAAIALFVIAPALNFHPFSNDIALADKDADKGKSDEDHGKSDEDHGKSGKDAPSAPELPGILMILSAAGAIGGGYMLRKRQKKD